MLNHGACRLATILPEVTLTEAIQTTRMHSGAGLTRDRRIPADLGGVETIHAACVARQRSITPPGQTCPCLYRRFLPHVTAAAPSREGTHNTYG